MMTLWVAFLMAFIAGFITMWVISIDDEDTGFVIFESEEELQQACWDGMRKGVK
jgi:hypothetical protein